MRRLSIIAAATLLSGNALCSSINIPTPDNIPLFWGILNQDPKYHDAAFKAQQAFLNQSGFTSGYNKLTEQVSSRGTAAIKYVVENGTPFSAKDVFFVVGTAYAAGVKKQFTKKFRDPLFHSITHTITIGSTTSTSVQIPF